MGRSGAMSTSAWNEIRDARGNLVDSIPARIEGGRVTDWESRVLKRLPSNPTIFMAQLD